MSEFYGLTEEEVAERQSQGHVNNTGDVKTKTIGRIILEHTMTLFNLLNFALAIWVLSVGSIKNAFFLGVVFGNTAIGIVQEIRSKRMVDRLSLMVEGKVEVIRSGKAVKISDKEIVRDDIIHLKRGQAVPADCLVIKGSAQLNESLLTGESDLIPKKENDELLSGSYLSGGDVYARVIHVGKENFAAKIGKEAKTVKKSESEIMRTLRKIIGIITVILFPAGYLLFTNQSSLEGATYSSAVVGTVAALISMIPEGLMLLTSSVLAVSVIRLAMKNVLVQQLYCIETLARVDVLCLDKTGTITNGKMKINGMLGLGTHTREEISTGFSYLMSVSRDQSPTVDAIKAAFPGETDLSAAQIVDFSSERKWSGASFADGSVYVMGAGEMIFGEKAEALESHFRSKIGTNRVIYLAKAQSEDPAQAFGEEGNEHLPEGLKPVGVLLIHDEIREEAKDTFRYFDEQGVNLKVISGDGVATVSRIAEEAGIKNADLAVDARTLTTEEDIYDACEKYTVFARVSPDQKRQLVRSLQKHGHTVAMTGDGVNDILAMKESDCSVAMASGSDAARNVAQLVLTTDDFSSMPSVVQQGRQSINNIQRSASMFLTKTVFAIILGIVFAFVTLSYPFEPIQMSFISSVTIGFPSLVLALEPNNERISGNFFYNIITRALAGGLTMALGVFLAYLAGYLFHLEQAEISTLAVALCAMTEIFLLYRISQPFNLIRGLLFGAVILAVVLAFLILPGFLSLVPMSWKMLLLILGIGCINGVVFFLLYALMERWRSKTLSIEYQQALKEKARERADRRAKDRARRREEWETASGAYKGAVLIVAAPIAFVRALVSGIKVHFGKNEE